MKLYAPKTTSSKDVIQILEQFFFFFFIRGSTFTAIPFYKSPPPFPLSFIVFLPEVPLEIVIAAIERFNKILTPMLAKISDTSPEKHWYQIVGQAYNTSSIVHHVTRGISVHFYGEGNRPENTSPTLETISPESHTILFLTSPMIPMFLIPVGQFRNFVFRSCRTVGKS